MRAERESWEKKQQEVGQLASELRNVRVTTIFHTYIRISFALLPSIFFSGFPPLETSKGNSSLKLLHPSFNISELLVAKLVTPKFLSNPTGSIGV